MLWTKYIPSPIHGGPTTEQAWVRPTDAWTQDLWGCPVVSGNKALEADLLSSVSCEVGHA